MFRFSGGTPVKIVCDNLKNGVTLHPKRSGGVLNEVCLSFGEYYTAAIMPTGVKKPKQKAGVEGSVGKIATAVIAKLRNDTFPSLAALNAGIRKAVKEFHDRHFRKRSGSRPSIFETEEKPYLRALPLIPYEVCEWSYGHKAGSNAIYGGTKASIPFHTGIVDTGWMSNLTAILYLSIIAGRRQQGIRYFPGICQTACRQNKPICHFHFGKIC